MAQVRASRLVSILLLLQTRGRLTARELAGILQVSVRTIYRDMDALSSAGVPLYGEPGLDGGYRVLAGYRTRLTGLTAQEAQTLFLTGLPGAAADLGLGAAVAAAQLKLTAALPAELREQADLVRQRFHHDAPSWYAGAEQAPHLTAVAEAVWNQHQVAMRYYRWAEPHEITRTVDPYGVVLKAGRWYLVGHDQQQIRTYRVSRILDLDALAERFEWPAGFDLAAYWQGYLARFDERRHREQAVLRLSPEGFARLPDLTEAAVADAARQTGTEPGEDGWRQVTIPVESAEQAVPELLKLGAEAEVLAPPRLREQIVRVLCELSALYQRPPPAAG
jgi:predicted DNA-binding transcriptional regulator YafY